MSEKTKDLTDEDYIKIGKGLIDIIREAFGINVSSEIPEAEAEIIERIALAEDEQPPWMIEAFRWNGKNEVDDQAELEAFLGFNPNDRAGGLSWCAGFINSVLAACGLEGTGSNLALSFSQSWGQPCKCVDGAVVVWDGGNVPGAHVGLVKGAGVFGGNQGDMARLNRNRAWFDQEKTLVGYFWPREYEIPAGYELDEVA